MDHKIWSACKLLSWWWFLRDVSISLNWQEVQEFLMSVTLVLCIYLTNLEEHFAFGLLNLKALMQSVFFQCQKAPCIGM